MKQLLLVGLGGCVGSIARYKLGGWILHHYSLDWRFPLGTFAVNVIGCLVAGVLAGLMERQGMFTADTGVPIAGLVIPYWRELLAAAVRLSERLEMGYVGIDFVLDNSHGPVVLEANARPGLSIQLANRAGLLPNPRPIMPSHSASVTIHQWMGTIR